MARRRGSSSISGEQRDVRPYIRAASIVVLPTYREGMSRALLEGAAMGKPLIGTDVAGSRELIDDGVTGLLCQARNRDIGRRNGKNGTAPR